MKNKYHIFGFVLILFIFLMKIIVYNQCLAASYYVKNGGDDNKQGLSDDEAWATIGKVNNFKFSDGDAVSFKRGDTFADATLLNPKVNNFVIQSYGEGKKPIIDGNKIQPIRIYGDIKIKNLTIKDIDISGSNRYENKDNNITLQNINNLIISGVIGDGKATGGFGKNAIGIKDCEGNIIIKECVLSNWGPEKIPSGGTDFMGIAIIDINIGLVEIYNNKISNIEADCVHLYRCSVDTHIHDNLFWNAGENIIDVKASSNCQIYRNEMYNTNAFLGIGGQGGKTFIVVHSVISAPDCQVKNNKIYSNYFHDTIDGEAIHLGGEPNAVEGIDIYYNKFVNCKGNIRILNTSGLYFYYNLLINPIGNSESYGKDMGGIYLNNGAVGTNYIYSNTIYNGQGTCKQLVCLAHSGPEGVHIINNIISQAIDDPNFISIYWMGHGQTPKIENNCLYKKGGGNIVKWKKNYYHSENWNDFLKICPDNIFDNPQFIDITLNRFELLPASPCIDKGVPLDDKFSYGLSYNQEPFFSEVLQQNEHGSSWEIGAFVYGISKPKNLAIIY